MMSRCTLPCLLPNLQMHRALPASSINMLCHCILPCLLPTGQLHVQGLRLLRTAPIPGAAVQHAARAQRLTDYMVSKGSIGLQVTLQPMQAPPQAHVVIIHAGTATTEFRNRAV